MARKDVIRKNPTTSAVPACEIPVSKLLIQTSSAVAETGENILHLLTCSLDFFGSNAGQKGCRASKKNESSAQLIFQATGAVSGFGDSIIKTCFFVRNCHQHKFPAAGNLAANFFSRRPEFCKFCPKSADLGAY